MCHWIVDDEGRLKVDCGSCTCPQSTSRFHSRVVQEVTTPDGIVRTVTMCGRCGEVL